MELNPKSRGLALVLVLLLSLAGPTHAYVYSCDPTAVCGCSQNPTTLTRIVGGEPAGDSTWGWIVSIYVDSDFQCGGSILSSTWIISAAHCFPGINASDVTIYAGSNTVGSGQARNVSVIIVHPNYDPVSKENDIALLRLSSPLDMSDPNVTPICMPSISSAVLAEGEWPPAGLYVAAAGWGALSEGGSLPMELQQVTLQTFDYASAFCDVIVNNPEKQLCAGVVGGAKDTCQGDSGGPLVMFTASEQWELVGLTSYGRGCARPESAGVYTRVAYYQSWILSITGASFTAPTSSDSANINPYPTTTTTVTTTTRHVTMHSSASSLSLSFSAFFLLAYLA